MLPLYGVAVALCAVTLAVSKWVNFYSWTRLFVGILVYTLVYILCMWTAVVNKEEKVVLIRSFFRTGGT